MTDSPAETPVRIVIVGHVDHGKSTLIGRLLYDTGSLPPQKLAEIEAASRRRGMKVELAHVLDALQAERDQGITIDATQVWFRTGRRSYCIIDAPGHKEFLKNMVTGASRAHAALVIIDAREGVQEQSLRHACLLQVLGIRQLAVIINKMDLVGYASEPFHQIQTRYSAYLQRFGLETLAFIPVCATLGEQVTTRSTRMPWYEGPPLLAVLDEFKVEETRESLPLRMPVQAVYKFDDRRLIAGRLESGVLNAGDRILFSPSNKLGRIRSVERFPRDERTTAVAGESVALTLEEQIFIQRGEVISHPESPPLVTTSFDARLFWLSKTPLRAGEMLRLKMLTAEVPVRVQRIHRCIDPETLETRPATDDSIAQFAIAELSLRTGSPVAIDSPEKFSEGGRFVVVRGHEVAGGGLASVTDHQAQRAEGARIHSGGITWTEPKVGRLQRERQNGHRGGVVWLTGLSGAGKSTIAQELDRRLFASGCHTYVLDGDNVRHGLNRDLGFSQRDRAENIRRIGEVAKILMDSGAIVVTAFISPYRAEREMVRSLFGAGEFFEVFVSCPIGICEQRDPKGLYKKARAGDIPDFTGISAPYEAPQNPELQVETDRHDPEECARRILDHLARVEIIDLVPKEPPSRLG